MEWLFDRLGTAIITLIIGLITGGTVGYRIGIKKSYKVNQKQTAGDKSSQIQVGRDYDAK